MSINLLLLTALLFQTQITSSSSILLTKIVNYEDNVSFISAKSTGNGYEILEDPGDMKIGIYEENDYDVEYASALKISLKGFENLNITSATLTLYKKEGYSSTLNVKYLYNYDLLNSNPLDVYVYNGTESVNLTGNYFTINIKDNISHFLSLNKEEMYLIFQKSSSVGTPLTLFGDTSDGYFPRLSINTTTIPNVSSVGAAEPYFHISPGGVIPTGSGIARCNCYGYAFGNYEEYDNGEFNDGFIATNDNLNEVTNRIINEVYLKFGIKSRIIDSYDSLIFPFEYRVVFRFVLGTSSYHFLKQTSTSAWAYVLNENMSGSYLLDIGVNPESFVWDINNNYNSDYVYLAVWR